MWERLPRATADEVLRALRRDEWTIVRQKGSHVILRHSVKTGYVEVARHARATIKPGTMKNILRQADLSADELRRLL